MRYIVICVILSTDDRDFGEKCNLFSHLAFSLFFLYWMHPIRTLMDYAVVLDEMFFSHHYLSLATSSKSGEPWASPICYVRHEKKSLYFISHTESIHVKHIEENPQVAFAIYDSRQIVGNAFGVQGKGTASKVEEVEVPFEVKTKLYEITSLVILERTHSFYRIDMEAVYLPDFERWKKESPIRTHIPLM
jgi:uncharacterized protein YhbP (UPF0306 family)